RRKIEDLKGGSAAKNARILLSVLEGEEREAKREIAVLNAAAGILVAGEAADFKEAVARAEESIDTRSALNRLNSFIEFSRSWKD
ncbi:MAG TPA: anthranilate phosphoribosyltransferase, partial [Thermodesulfobacteriota bacterium]|nr:anthranilate phosphoribosyltransferase [Thermodesulfobacteriota bacterium]